MSDSSPEDLAITFRGLPRRLREARGDTGAEVIADQLSAIDRHVTRAAELVGAPSSDPALIAAAIEAVPADAWGPELDELRTIALALGKRLRDIAAEQPDRND